MSFITQDGLDFAFERLKAEFQVEVLRVDDDIAAAAAAAAEAPANVDIWCQDDGPWKAQVEAMLTDHNTKAELLIAGLKQLHL